MDIKVLFVCIGNICRSPTAQGVFEDVVAKAGLADRIQIDSAGTHAYHVGEPPQQRDAVKVIRDADLELGAERCERPGSPPPP